MTPAERRGVEANALREAAVAAEQEPLDEWPFLGLDEMCEWLTLRADRIEATR